MTEYKRGDRVKVTIEGYVERADTVRQGTVTELKISTQATPLNSPCQYVYAVDGVDIEVLAPPARPYQVGDLVRGTMSLTHFMLGRAGYMIVKSDSPDRLGKFFFYGDRTLEEMFPTGNPLYELVEAAS